MPTAYDPARDPLELPLCRLRVRCRTLSAFEVPTGPSRDRGAQVADMLESAFGASLVVARCALCDAPVRRSAPRHGRVECSEDCPLPRAFRPQCSTTGRDLPSGVRLTAPLLGSVTAGAYFGDFEVVVTLAGREAEALGIVVCDALKRMGRTGVGIGRDAARAPRAHSRGRCHVQPCRFEVTGTDELREVSFASTELVVVRHVTPVLGVEPGPPEYATLLGNLAHTAALWDLADRTPPIGGAKERFAWAAAARDSARATVREVIDHLGGHLGEAAFREHTRGPPTSTDGWIGSARIRVSDGGAGWFRLAEHFGLGRSVGGMGRVEVWSDV